jgi:hypothetical protein
VKMQQSITWSDLDGYVQKAPHLTRNIWLNAVVPNVNQSLGFTGTWQPQALAYRFWSHAKHFCMVFDNPCGVHAVQGFTADSSRRRDVQEICQESPNGSIGNSGASQFDTQFFKFRHVVLFSAARVLRMVARVAFLFSHKLERELHSRGSSVQEVL